MSGTREGNKTLLFVNPWFGPLGPNVGMRQMAIECLRRGHRVVVVVQESDEFLEALRAQGVEAHVMPALEMTPRTRSIRLIARHLWRSWRTVRQITRLCRQVNADTVCINCENLFLMPRIGPSIGRHSVVVMRGARFGELGVLSRVYFAIQKRWTWRYVAVSHTVKGILTNLGVPPQQVEVICNGVDAQTYRPGPARHDIRCQLGIAPGAPLFGDVSVVLPRKGAHHLVEVLHRVRQVLPEACCVIVGDTDRHGSASYAQQLRQRARELGVQDGLILTGNRSDIPDVLREMDLMVHPTETESFGRAIAEAMATGLPVVGFAVGAVQELIDDGQTGRIIQPFDIEAMAAVTIELLKNPSLCRRLGQAGRQKVMKQYDVARNVAALIDVLEQAAAPQG